MTSAATSIGARSSWEFSLNYLRIASSTSPAGFFSKRVSPVPTSRGEVETKASKATRDGAPPIDLIDGSALCELLKEHRMEVRTETRHVEDVYLDHAFFTDV